MMNVLYVKNTLANCDENMYLPIFHLSKVVRIALQVARKIALCDRAAIYRIVEDHFPIIAYDQENS